MKRAQEMTSAYPPAPRSFLDNAAAVPWIRATNQTHDAILIWEFPRTILYWNRGAEQLYGFSREEAIGRPSHEILHTEHPMTTSEFDAALERDREWTGELKHTTRGGRKIIVESRHVMMRETDGRPLVLETNRDITERYYRLNVFSIRIPPLRERREDIPLLVQYFMEKYARRMGNRIEIVPRPRWRNW